MVLALVLVLAPVLVMVLAQALVLAVAKSSARWCGVAMGMVLNYHTGLMISRASRVWPTLAKLLCRFTPHQEESFRYTTIQVSS